MDEKSWGVSLYFFIMAVDTYLTEQKENFCSLTMLPYSFFVLRLVSFYRDINWTEEWKINLYNCYTFTILSIMYTNVLSQIIAVISKFQSVDELIDNTFILCTTVNIVFKATSFVKNRQNIINLLRVYETYPCTPQNNDEQVIRSTFDRIIHNVSLSYMSFTACTVTLQTTVRWIQVVPQGQLFYRAWLPYNNSYPLTFWISHIHQMICQFFGASLNCSYDVIVAALMIHISAQFVLLDYRFEKLPETIENDFEHMKKLPQVKQQYNYEQLLKIETMRLAERIRHHLLIFKCIKISNNIFSGTIFAQYMASSFVLCATVYKVSIMTGADPELPGILMYLTCMLFDVFLPCFFGNQATIASYKVSEAIYNMQWFQLTTSTQKSLVLVMNRCLKPFRFTSGYIIQLSLESFSGLAKTSYSVFNLLKQKGS